MFDMKELAKGMLDAMKAYVAKTVAPVAKGVEDLSQEFTKVKKDAAELPGLLSKQVEDCAAAIKEELSTSLGETIATKTAELVQSVETLKEEVSTQVKAVADTQAAAEETINKTVQDVDSKVAEKLAEIAPMVENANQETAADLRRSIAAITAKLEEKLSALDALEIPAGVDGKDGEPGRDAVAIEVLPNIDEARSYPPRTYASHKGGLWVARTGTKGMKGWECIINGVASVDIVPGNDARNYSLQINTSNGAQVEKRIRIPGMIFKGVYSSNQEYEQGDSVRWGGNVYVANKTTKQMPDEHASDWDLGATKGRDGRKGDEGKPGKTITVNQSLHKPYGAV